MEKVKKIFKDIKYKELAKLLGICFVCIYTVLSVTYTVNNIYQFNSTNEIIKADRDIFEQLLKDKEELILEEKKFAEDDPTSNDPDGLMYYESRYPNAMNTEKAIGGQIGEQADILRHAILYSILIAIVIYLYKNTKKILKLVIKYLILFAIVLIVNEQLYLLPSVHTQIGDTMIVYSLGRAGTGGSSDDNLIKLFCLITIATITIKIIKNRLEVKKLNSLMDSEK